MWRDKIVVPWRFFLIPHAICSGGKRLLRFCPNSQGYFGHQRVVKRRENDGLIGGGIKVEVSKSSDPPIRKGLTQLCFSGPIFPFLPSVRGAYFSVFSQ